MSHANPTEIDRHFPSELGSAAAARREIEKLSWMLDTDEAEVLALLVTELIANSVQHADTPPGADVSLEASVTPDVVHVSVTDGGKGFVAPFRRADSPINSHWGLHLVDQLASRWEVNATPSTAVTFELDRPPTPAATAEDGANGTDRLSRALAEQARLGEAYERAVGKSGEMASYVRLQAAGREVAVCDAALRAVRGSSS
jgi:anti-sigma regulatory factor (Ser/Thr protein kinase)